MMIISYSLEYDNRAEVFLFPIPLIIVRERTAFADEETRSINQKIEQPEALAYILLPKKELKCYINTTHECYVYFHGE